MISRQPARTMLPHTVTLRNLTGETVSGGAKVKQYQKTVIRYVRYESRRRTNMLKSGGTNNDSLFLMIFNGPSVAAGEDGARRKYAPPDVFLTMPPEEQAAHWTLRAGDAVGLGILPGDISPGGDRARKDYKINMIDPVFGADGKIHHWEVTGA